MKASILTIEIRTEADVALARQRARFLAELLRFEPQDQTRIATAVSEAARNAFQYAGSGRVQFSVEEDGDRFYVIRVSDQGPGIANLGEVLEGRHSSATGIGVGLRGAGKLMHAFRVDSAPGQGTTVELARRLPQQTPDVTPAFIDTLSKELARRRSAASPMDEVRQQNQELLRALAELEQRQEELTQLNRELAETNSGVVALYSELEERAEALRRTSEVKARVYSEMNHEVRTPINAIVSLSEILLNGTVTQPLPEQQKPLEFIRKAARQLSELVDDILDLAKVEAGKMVVRSDSFSAPELFGALRGMFRPLHINEGVALVFENTWSLPPLHTDEGKVSQILRNLISNALKFTEHGEVRISAVQDGEQIAFSVADTGIGISAEDQQRLFQEFAQLSNTRKHVKGTGLGLALSRNLAQLLGGDISVTSSLGKGSTFRLTIPRVYIGPEQREAMARSAAQTSRIPVLVIASALETFRLYEQHLEASRFRVLPASTLEAAHLLMDSSKPRIVIFDSLMEDERSWTMVQELSRQAEGQALSILMVGMSHHRERAEALGIQDFALPPVERGWLLDRLVALAEPVLMPKILIIDDDEIARYVLKTALGQIPYSIIEASTGPEGIEQARQQKPRVIFLDLTMPDMTGFEVLDRLRGDPATQDIPIIVNTSKRLTARERTHLAALTVAILSKESPLHDDGAAKFWEALRKAGLPDNELQTR